MKPILSRFNRQVATCTFCPKMCRFTCPIDRVEGSETSSPWGKMTALAAVQKQMVPLEGEVLSAVYKCTGCNTCRTACLHGQELPPVFEAARALAAGQGIAHPRLYDKDRAMRLHGNPVGPHLSAELGRLVPAHRFGRRARLLVFFGCTTVARFPQIIQETIRVLSTAGVDFAVSGPQKLCSGLPSLSHGFPERLREVAARNIESFRGYSHVVSDCPGAVSTIARHYPALGLPRSTRLEHLSVFLLGLLRDKRLDPKTARVRRAFYHDACHLGRYLGAYDEPRELVARLLGEPARELAFNRQLSPCSGGGGGLPITQPELAAGIAKLPVEETRMRGGDTLISACPTARRMFTKAGSEVEVLDPVTLLARGL